jgi:hypothetical protein
LLPPSRLRLPHSLRRYVLLDGWKPESKYHQELMALHLRGNGCAKTPTIAEDLQFFTKVRAPHASIAAAFASAPHRHSRPVSR